jgi:hypothetical protein
VDVKESRPGHGCINATVISAPYTIISFSRKELNRGEINLNLTEMVTKCGG